eukprot:TRINITY_DN34146_c0_g1_i1.p1 TRINITY_DN34146_c0_g1~~TRINITY_DN34146_c0_g1_i1.p1  ORF type:complete len:617 (+),score=211.37 TRINITY_DN34146_c0_g1_i1:78-1853(+)
MQAGDGVVPPCAAGADSGSELSTDTDDEGPSLQATYHGARRRWLPWWRFEADPEGTARPGDGCGYGLLSGHTWTRLLRLACGRISFWMCLATAEFFCWACIYWRLTAQTHPNLFITCVVFPLAFSIHSAFHRHERALDELGTMRAAVQACFQLHVDWHLQLTDPAQQDVYGRSAPSEQPRTRKEQDEEGLRWQRYHRAWGRAHLRSTYGSCVEFLDAATAYFRGSDMDWHDRRRRAAGSEHPRDAQLRRVYAAIRALSEANERLRSAAKATEQRANDPRCPDAIFFVAAPFLTRPIHWTYMLGQSFEKVRGIRDHRSPTSVRSYTKTGTFIVPIALGPWLAWLAGEYENWVAYYVCFCVTLVFSALREVQDTIENPFSTEHSVAGVESFSLLDLILETRPLTLSAADFDRLLPLLREEPDEDGRPAVVVAPGWSCAACCGPRHGAPGAAEHGGAVAERAAARALHAVQGQQLLRLNGAAVRSLADVLRIRGLESSRGEVVCEVAPRRLRKGEPPPAWAPLASRRGQRRDAGWPRLQAFQLAAVRTAGATPRKGASIVENAASPPTPPPVLPRQPASWRVPATASSTEPATV